MSLLEVDRIRQIYEAAIRVGLANARDALLSGCDPFIVAGLPKEASPDAQLFSDLNHLSRVGVLQNGRVPLHEWLEAARVFATGKKDERVFAVALAWVSAVTGAASNEPPRRFSQETWYDLEDVLADLYPGLDDGRRIADAAGLATARIELSSKALTNWHNILSEAQRAGRLGAVLAVAVHEYPGNDRLQRLVRAFHQLGYVLIHSAAQRS